MCVLVRCLFGAGCFQRHALLTRILPLRYTWTRTIASPGDYMVMLLVVMSMGFALEALTHTLLRVSIHPM